VSPLEISLYHNTSLPFSYGKEGGKNEKARKPNQRMGNYKMKINYLAEQTGLTRKYIDKCYSKFPDLLKETRARMHDGAPWMYDGNALIIFRQIRDLRDQQKDLPAIRGFLQKELGKQETTHEKGEEAEENPGGNRDGTGKKNQSETEPNTTQVFVSAIKDMQTDFLKVSEGARDREVRAKDEVIQVLRSQFLLLEESHEEKKRQEKERKEEIEKLRVENEKKEEEKQQKAKQRQEIISKIEALEGKWFVKKKRAKALIDLKELV